MKSFKFRFYLIALSILSCAQIVFGIGAEAEQPFSIGKLADEKISLEEKVALIESCQYSHSVRKEFVLLLNGMKLPVDVLGVIGRYLIEHGARKETIRCITAAITEAGAGQAREATHRAAKAFAVATLIGDEELHYHASRELLRILPKTDSLAASALLTANYDSISFSSMPDLTKTALLEMLAGNPREHCVETILCIILNSSAKFYLGDKDLCVIARYVKWPERMYLHDLAIPSMASNLLRLVTHQEIPGVFPDWQSWLEKNQGFSIEKASVAILASTDISLPEFNFALSQLLAQRVAREQCLSELKRIREYQNYDEVVRNVVPYWERKFEEYQTCEDQVNVFFSELRADEAVKKAAMAFWKNNWDAAQGEFDLFKAAILEIESRQFDQSRFDVAADILRGNPDRWNDFAAALVRVVSGDIQSVDAQKKSAKFYLDQLKSLGWN